MTAAATSVLGEHLPGMLGHELRNPLASAVTGAMLVRDLIDEHDPRAALLDNVLGDLDRMTGLIEGWLAMARGRRAATEVVPLATLLETVARRHRAELLACPAGAAVRGNRALLERALDNLCENAWQAGAKAVRIAAQGRGDDLLVHIEDDGHGVSAADATRVFESGWSTHGSTGLGLCAVATTVRVHHGKVRCVPLERGTRFTLELPAAS